MASAGQRDTLADIGPFVPIREMGQGGAGVVWLCLHRATGAAVAVKIVRDDSYRQRTLLRREISMLSRLAGARHRGIVHLLESGSHGGLLWYSMEHIEGAPLAALLDSSRSAAGAATVPANGREPTAHAATAIVTAEAVGATSPAGSVAGGSWPGSSRRVTPQTWPVAWPIPDLHERLWIAAEIADALSLLHREGIVHGDLSPSNVLLRPDLTPVLVDFGLAFHAVGGASAREVAQIEGVPLGTPGYMAPEQIAANALDARCDLYALGCILYELVHNRPPFEADTVAALLKQHAQRPLAQPAMSHDLDAELLRLIAALLEKDRRHRLGQAEEVVSRLAGPYRGTRRLPLSRGPGGLYRATLVGRGEPLTRLSSLLAATKDERTGEALVLVGESGVGKTRLLNEASARAADLGLEVVTGQCGAMTGAEPGLRAPVLHGFLPFLQRCADRCTTDPELLDGVRSAVALLAPYEPALAALTDGDTSRAPSELRPEVGSGRVIRALASMLARYAVRQPLLLILDDLQWADELTLSFWMSPEIRAALGSAVSIVAACREREGDQRLRDWLEKNSSQVVRLTRLGSPDIRMVAREMLGTAMIPTELADTIERRSQGNPFFVAEYLRAFLVRGWLKVGPQGWAFDEKRAAAFVPSSVEVLFQERFSGLRAEARAMVQVAAVLGREFHRELLGAALRSIHGEPADRAEVALDELVGREILEPAGDDQYRFVHDQLREAVLRALDAAQLAALNRDVAGCFEAAGGRFAQASDAQLGVYRANAGQAAAALPHLERAAAHAERVFAVSRAVELYRLALEQAERLDLPGASAPATSRVAESLADVLARAAHHDEARLLYQRALVAVGAPQSVTASRLLRKEAQSYFTVHRYDEARRALDQAEAYLPAEPARGSDAWREWIEIEQTRFWTLYYGRRTGAETVAVIARMWPVVMEHGTNLQRSNAYQCAAADLAGRLRYAASDEVLAFSRRALAELDGVPGHALERAGVRFQIGFGLIRGSEEECLEAASLLAAVAQEADRMGDITLLARAHTYRAVALRRCLDTGATLQAARDAYTAAEAAQLPPYMGASAACSAWAAWRGGDRASATRGIAEAMTLWGRSPHVFPFRWLANLMLLDHHRADENFTAAALVVTDLLSTDQQVLAEPVASSLAAAGEACAGDDAARIDRTLARALETARQQRYL